jgi:hypothetical protein
MNDGTKIEKAYKRELDILLDKIVFIVWEQSESREEQILMEIRSIAGRVGANYADPTEARSASAFDS